MTASNAPTSAKPTVSAGPTPNGTGSHPPRPQNRARRETSVQLGRNSRNSAGLRSASVTAEAMARPVKPPTSMSGQETLV